MTRELRVPARSLPRVGTDCGDDTRYGGVATVRTVRYRDVFRRQDVMVRRLCSAIAEQRVLAENTDGQQPTSAALLHNFEDGFQVQRAVEAALRSSRKGRWVRLDDVFNPALDGV